MADICSIRGPHKPLEHSPLQHLAGSDPSCTCICPLSQDCGKVAIDSCLPAQTQLQLRPCILGKMSGGSQRPLTPGAPFQRSARERTQQGQSPHPPFSSRQPIFRTASERWLGGEQQGSGGCTALGRARCFSVYKESLFQPPSLQLLHIRPALSLERCL